MADIYTYAPRQRSYLQLDVNNVANSLKTLREDQERAAQQRAALTGAMAQACAAMSGYIAVYIRHIPFSIGYLGQVRGLDVKRFPRTGETLRTSVRTIEEIFGILMAEVWVFSDGELLASAIIKTAAATEQG